MSANTNRAARPIILALLMAGNVYTQASPRARLVRDSYGGIIRGDVNTKKLALVFTGDEFGESLQPILESLNKRKIKGSFFVTGNFLRQAKLKGLLERAVAEGHYIGPHSDSHPLYASWDNRDKSLVTEAFFTLDLKRNLATLGAIGALRREHNVYFIPPYEQFNHDQVNWSQAMDVTLINFTPGSGSNRDYAREDDPKFVSSKRIHDDILAYEKKDPHGLSGFILLLHLGSGRKDPFHQQLGPLCDELSKRGYEFARIDELLKPAVGQ
jgi:peptidoglycan/xylan/chitin deacetylase (PgdA/CDA1 family)